MRTLIASALLVLSATAQASSPIFSDSFEDTAAGLNLGPAGWTVSGGSVDVVSTPDWGLCAGTGNCVDLDGTSGQAGLLSRSFTLEAGYSYTLSFDMSGNRRGPDAPVSGYKEQVLVSFGTASSLIDLGLSFKNTPWTAYSLSFTALETADYALSFLNLGDSDNRGALLDNVSISRSGPSISPVPEPSSYALMLAGLLTMGSLARRRASR